MESEVRAKLVYALCELGTDEWILANLTDKHLLTVVAGVLSGIADNLKNLDEATKKKIVDGENLNG